VTLATSQPITPASWDEAVTWGAQAVPVTTNPIKSIIRTIHPCIVNLVFIIVFFLIWFLFAADKFPSLE
jgi:hypothetical protein